jgi:large subunit ribosomal protein L33
MPARAVRGPIQGQPRPPASSTVLLALRRVGERGWLSLSTIHLMQEVVTLECTEARKEGKPVSRYLTTRNKKTVTERIEKKKYNPHLKRHTLHKEIK